MTADLIARALEVVASALGPEATYVVRPTALRDSDTLAGRIDHTLLKADATLPQINHLCQEAMEHQFASVCVNSRWVPTVSETLRGSGVLTCTVVGFPLGAMTRRAKAREAAIAVEEGADEVDMVMDIGGLLSGDLAGVFEDMQGVAGASDGRPVKVIIETCLLTDEQKVIACLLAQRAGAAYVKTSTGMSTGGATVEDIALMRAVVGEQLGVKASGGIRTREDAERMLAAGADRVGASASVAIVLGGTGGTGY
jgi:deoxyribose-phosphate aldolase